MLPRSIQRGLRPKTDWTAGFFPGTLWYLYTYTGKEEWKTRAEHATGNFLRNSELDGALSYADYYYMEGLLRYLRLLDGQELYKVATLP